MASPTIFAIPASGPSMQFQRTLVLAFLAMGSCMPHGLSQTLPSGVINAPPTFIGNNQSIGASTTLNVGDGGVVGSFFSANAGSVTNVFGGTVGDWFDARSGSYVNIEGGMIGEGFDVMTGAIVDISGGVFANGFHVGSGGTVRIAGGSFRQLVDNHSDNHVELDGGEFRLDGMPYGGNSVSLSTNSVLTGTFADGSPFVFSGFTNDLLFNATLTSAPLPTANLNPITIDATNPSDIVGLRSGQSLALQEGGELAHGLSTIDAAVTFEGGTVYGDVESVDSEITISNGLITGRLIAYSGSSINISGGRIADSFHIRAGSSARISGGSFGSKFDAMAGGVELIGGEFLLNGAPYTGATITLGEGDVFTGKLADGSSFLFSDYVYSQLSDSSDRLQQVKLTTSDLPAVQSTEQIVDQRVLLGLPTIGSGQTVRVAGDGRLPNSQTMVGGTLWIEQGNLGSGISTVGSGLEAAHAEVNIDGGRLGSNAQLYTGTTLNILGGRASHSLVAHAGSVVNIYGGFLDSSAQFIDATLNLQSGDVGDNMSVTDGSVVSMDAGSIGKNFNASEDSTINVRGGRVLEQFKANSGTIVQLSGGQIRDQFQANGSTIHITGGEVWDDFQANGESTVNISGGEIRDDFQANSGSTVNLLGGNIGFRFQANSESVVNVTGGVIGPNFTAREGSRVNVGGGTIGLQFVAESGSVVQITGGSVSDGFKANAGSSVTISGGTVGNSLTLENGSRVEIAGGSVGGFAPPSGSIVTITGGQLSGHFSPLSGSSVAISGGTFSTFAPNAGSLVDLHGGEFRLNGVPYTASHVSLSAYDVFSGTLADGSPFLFTHYNGDALNNVKLVTTELPALSTATIIVDASHPAGPPGLRAGQSLTLHDGGELPINFTAVGASVTVEGGVGGDNLEAYESELNLLGGTMGSIKAYSGTNVIVSNDAVTKSVGAYAGSVVAMSGGTVEGSLTARADSNVVVNDGTITGSILATSDSVFSLRGGSLQGIFRAEAGSNVEISGGEQGYRFLAEAGSDVELVGGDFRLNGEPYEASTITMSAGDVLTGTFSDGNPFILSGLDAPTISSPFPRDIAIGVKLNNVSLPAIDTTPVVVDSSTLMVPHGLRPGQSLSLHEGGMLPAAFSAVGAAIVVQGGRVESYLKLSESSLSIHGGTVGGRLRAHAGSVINLTDGHIWGTTISESELNISGGEVVEPIATYKSSIVNVAGGLVGHTLEVNEQSELNVTGGQVAGALRINSGSVANLHDGVFGYRSGTRFRTTVDVNLDATANISGGLFGEFVYANAGSTINFSGGVIEGYLRAKEGSQVNLSGGIIGEVDGQSGSMLEVTGGSYKLSGASGSQWLISGGTVASGSTIRGDAIISGGVFEGGFRTFDPARVELRGSDFRWNGVPYDGDTIAFSTVPRDTPTRMDGDVFSGTLEDGTSFVFTHFGSDLLQNIVLTRVPAGTPAPPLILVDGNSGDLQGVRPGQTVIVHDAGVLRHNFSLASATLSVDGGSVGPKMEAAYSDIHVSGGSIGAGFNAYFGTVVSMSGGTMGRDSASHAGSIVNVFGGTVESNFRALDGSTVRVAGGSVGSGFQVFDQATVNVESGTIGSGFQLLAGSTVNVTGGSLTSLFARSGSKISLSGVDLLGELDADAGSAINIEATAFALSGVPMTGLEVGESLLVTTRNQILSATFADGSVLNLPLYSANLSFRGYVHTSALLTITLVSTSLPGDFNNDGKVNLADYSVWRDNLGAEENGSMLSGNGDGGFVDQADYDLWKTSFGRSIGAPPVFAAVVPEPPTIAISSCVLMACITFWRLSTSRGASRLACFNSKTCPEIFHRC